MKSETQENILVTSGSATFVEFKFKPKNVYDGSSKLRKIYKNSEKFLYYRKRLILACICGLYIDRYI